MLVTFILFRMDNKISNHLTHVQKNGIDFDQNYQH
jgi:hypothetical protein